MIESVKDLFTANTVALLLHNNLEPPKRRTIVINEIENKTDEIYDLHNQVQSLVTEVEVINLFIKEQFY